MKSKLNSIQRKVPCFQAYENGLQRDLNCSNFGLQFFICVSLKMQFIRTVDIRAVITIRRH